MTVPLSVDLRERIVAAVEAGSSRRRAAERFAVSHSTAIKLMQRVGETGSVAPAKIGGYRKPKLEEHEATLRAIVDAKPDITLAGIRSELESRAGVLVCQSTIHEMLRRLGLRFKKRV
jgi:putative transposase